MPQISGQPRKTWDFYGFRTRMFEDGIATLVSSAPEAIGKKAYPLLAAIKAPAKLSTPAFKIVIAIALFGTCQLTRSEPVMLCSLTLPLEKSTLRFTAMASPAKIIFGNMPPIAICIGASAGEGVIQTKSLFPFEVERERMAATKG